VAARAVVLPAAALLLGTLLLGAVTPVPSEDGVSYLWLAQRFAAFDFVAGTDTPFPPGYPLLLAPWLALGAPPELVALLLGALSLAACCWPLAALARALGGEAAVVPTLWLFAASPLLPRLGAEVYSEPPFLLLMAWGAWWGQRERWWCTGLAAGLAFWIRPEAALLAVSYSICRPRTGWRCLVPLALAVLALAALRAGCGHGFSPLPIHAFHDLRDDLPERGRWLHNLLALPGPWCEGLGLAALLVLPRLWPRRGAERPLVLQVLGQIVVVLTFVVRRRFFVSAAIAVHALAGQTLAALQPPLRRALLVAAGAFTVVANWNGRIDADRAVERELGLWLQSQLAVGQTVVSELPRVAWFAGQRPPPPRRMPRDYYATAAKPDAVAFVVLRQGEAVGPGPSWLSVELPHELGPAIAARRLLVFRRR
jgi:hypothetical protein